MLVKVQTILSSTRFCKLITQPAIGLVCDCKGAAHHSKAPVLAPSSCCRAVRELRRTSATVWMFIALSFCFVDQPTPGRLVTSSPKRCLSTCRPRHSLICTAVHIFEGSHRRAARAPLSKNLLQNGPPSNLASSSASQYSPCVQVLPLSQGHSLCLVFRVHSTELLPGHQAWITASPPEKCCSDSGRGLAKSPPDQARAGTARQVSQPSLPAWPTACCGRCPQRLCSQSP